MYKAFEIAGYDRSVVDEKFSGMINAFRLAHHHTAGRTWSRPNCYVARRRTKHSRGYPLPMNQKAEDLMMGAPSTVTPKQLKELGSSFTADAKANSPASNYYQDHDPF